MSNYKKQKTKEQILQKYLSQDKSSRKKPQQSYANIRVIDEDVGRPSDSESSNSSDSEPEHKRQRIHSDDEEEEAADQTIAASTKVGKDDDKLRKKFREALGVEEQEIDDFLNDQLVIQNAQGIDLATLKRKKVKLTLQTDGSQLPVKQYGEEVNTKLEEFMRNNNIKKEEEAIAQYSSAKQQQRVANHDEDESDGSDVQVNRVASITAPPKTIYRNKDGTIRHQSIQQQKQAHKKEVMDRLAQWDKGMKQLELKNKPKEKVQFGNTDISDDYKLELAQRQLFQDPMKFIQTKMQVNSKIDLLKCKYPGPGNRFNIAPGHRWDGVIRGNGFQFKYILHKNDIKQKHDEQLREYLREL